MMSCRSSQHEEKPSSEDMDSALQETCFVACVEEEEKDRKSVCFVCNKHFADIHCARCKASLHSTCSKQMTEGCTDIPSLCDVCFNVLNMKSEVDNVNVEVEIWEHEDSKSDHLDSGLNSTVNSSEVEDSKYITGNCTEEMNKNDSCVERYSSTPEFHDNQESLIAKEDIKEEEILPDEEFSDSEMSEMLDEDTDSDEKTFQEHEEGNSINLISAHNKITKGTQSLEDKSPSRRRAKSLHSASSENGQGSHICSICGKVFKRRTHLTSHLRSHTGEKPFQCTQCDMKFSYKQYLTHHLQTHKGEEPFKCETCGKAFMSNFHVVEHIRSHTGERPFSCLKCDKKFMYKSNLVVHIRRHNNEKPYGCSLCGKTFATKCYLKHHIQLHSGQRLLQCSTCDKWFMSKSRAERHRLTHVPEQPYSCSVCNKFLWSKKQLESHLRAHTRDKPYKCVHCGVGCITRSGLHCHLILHSVENSKSEKNGVLQKD